MLYCKEVREFLKFALKYNHGGKHVDFTMYWTTTGVYAERI
jgi:hypothetical protein